jgi:hypothetical protein
VPAQILGLIDKLDGFEIVRDQIAAVLVVEIANQQAMATEEARDPSPWALRVFTNRARPWADFLSSPDPESASGSPIVNVWHQTAVFPMNTGNVVSHQRAKGQFFIDVYGYGISEDVEGGGHTPGDELAMDATSRAVRLCRNILFSGQYTYLGLQGVVGRRWLQSITFNPPELDENPIHQIATARMILEVDYLEFAPQVQGVPFDSLLVQVTRIDTGQVLLRAQYPNEE